MPASDAEQGKLLVSRNHRHAQQAVSLITVNARVLVLV
jgi:hypothetical protein